MAEFNTTQFDSGMERVAASMYGLPVERLEALIERKAGAFTPVEQFCLRTIHAARNADTEDAAWALLDAWDAGGLDLMELTRREFAFWEFADAAVETALRHAE